MHEIVCSACNENYAELPLLVCYYDRDDLRRALAELVEWYDAMLSPPVRGQNGQPSGKNHEQPIPISDRVTQVRAEILEILVNWASLHHEKTHPDGGVLPLAAVLPTRQEFIRAEARPTADQSTIDALVSYLTRYEDWFLTTDSDAAGAYVNEVLRLAEVALRTAAPGRREGVIIAVHQVESGNGTTIDCGNVWAKGVRENDTGRCAGCGLRQPMAQWYEENLPSGDDLLTDAQAVSYFAIGYGEIVAQKTIRVWRHRNEVLKDAGTRRNGVVVTPRKALDDFAQNRWRKVPAFGPRVQPLTA